MLRRALAWLGSSRALRVAGNRPDPNADVPDALWQPVIADYPFLAGLTGPEQMHLRALSGAFLARKEFHGANGLEVTDTMALTVAAQACLPLLHLGAGTGALDWYGDFVGIVLHPGEVLAPRESTDEAGVVHAWSEALTGEAMQGGPLTLSWQDVASAGASAATGYNVVVHEFIHVLDMHGKAGGAPDGCPLLPPGFMGQADRKKARIHWKNILQANYERFCDAVAAAERFGGLVPEPWLDPYGAQSVDEFFAVTGEAYFVSRQNFAAHFPELLPLYDAFFRRVPQ
jgi:Mlc titration factor MtfA (ptsG expression regulator)